MRGIFCRLLTKRVTTHKHNSLLCDSFVEFVEFACYTLFFIQPKEGNVMLSRLRLMLTGLFLSLALIACSDDAANTNEAADTAAPEVETTATESAQAGDDSAAVAEGTTEADLLAKYGEPDLKEETSVDTYQVVFYEWTTDEGVVSVQVHNGEVAFSQFTPK